MSASDKNLIEEIEKNSYSDLFLTENEELIKELWNEGKNEESLFHILEIDTVHDLTKLKIAELLFLQKIHIPKQYYQSIAHSYASCLTLTSRENNNSLGLSGNSWGFLYEDDDAGVLGSRFFVFGEESMTALLKLLNEDAAIEYEGSKSAMIGNDYQYRVKDFAAFYISKIKNISITFYQDFDKRDAEIERLKGILEKE